MKKILSLTVVLLLISGILCVLILASNKTFSESVDYPPQIMVDGRLYITDGQEKSGIEYYPIGTVKSCVDGSMIPEENNQANFECTGCEIYVSVDMPGYVFILESGHYMPFKLVTI